MLSWNIFSKYIIDFTKEQRVANFILKLLCYKNLNSDRRDLWDIKSSDSMFAKLP